MRADYEGLEVDMLQRLYHAKEKELESAVLSGTSWEVVTIQRRVLSELSEVLHNKLQRTGGNSPAGYYEP
jgi:hypothetical protein